MKVLHVCGMYPPATEWGGVANAVASYASALTQAGVHCEVFTTTARGSRDLSPIEPGTREVDGVSVTYFAARSVSQALIAPAIVPALARRLREFDLIHTHMLWAFPGIVADWTSVIGRVPYVVTPHGSLDPWALDQRKWIKRAFLAVSERHTLRRAAFVHYTADAERAAVPAWLYDVPSEIVPNVIDATQFSPGDPAVRHASFEVLILGRIHLMKGFDILIPAWCEVIAREPRARLVIAGPDEGGYRAEVERMIASAGVAATITFAGHIDAAGRAERFARAALLVQPSFRENFGMSVAEAMAAELPVVVSDRVNICDDIAAADGGLVVPRDPSALARAILALLADPDRRLAMGARGRALVERYSPAVVGAQLAAAYEATLRRRA